MKPILTIIMIILFLTCFSTFAYADEFDFPHTEKDSGDISESAKRLGVTVLNTEPFKREIQSFDVRNDYSVLLSYSIGYIKLISVYSESMEFLYGYRIWIDGIISVRWKDDSDNLLVYSVRGNMVYELDREGNLVNMMSVPFTDANQDYWYEVGKSPVRIINDREYYLENEGLYEIIDYRYAKMGVRVNGEDRILYDVADWFAFKIAAQTLITVGIFVLMMLGVKREREKMNSRFPSKL